MRERVRREAGSSSGTILILLMVLACFLAVCLGSGWVMGYKVPGTSGKEEPGPYAGYTDEQIDHLIAVYSSDRDLQMERLEKVTGRRVAARSRASLDKQVLEFSRAAEQKRRVNEARDEVAKRTVVLKQLEAEQRRRRSARDRGVMDFVRGLFRVSG